MNSDLRKQYEELELESLMKRAALIAAELELEEDEAIAADPEIPDPDPAEMERFWLVLEKKFEQTQRKESVKRNLRFGFKLSFSLAATLCIALVGLFVTVSAFRVPVSNYFYEKYDKYSRLVLDIDGYNLMNKPEGWESDYYPMFLPERFSFFKIKNTGDNLSILYIDDKQEILAFTVTPISEQTKADTENRVETPVDVNGLPASIFSRPDGTKTGISWHNGLYNFYIDGSVSKDEIMRVAESIQLS